VQALNNYMPMGLRVIKKVEAIVREEMNRAGGNRVVHALVQPAELWQETARFEKMGPELLRIKDRHDRDFVIQPTSEEVITDISPVKNSKATNNCPRTSIKFKPNSETSVDSQIWPHAGGVNL
jgi:prolyl-tRNA synthetase